MKQILAAAAFVTIMVAGAKAQADTSFYYYGPEYRTTTADSAAFVLKMYKSGDKWMGQQYETATGVLKFEGQYASNDPKTQDGEFKHYSKDGTGDYQSNWSQGSLLSKTWLHKDGSKRANITYKEGKIVYQAGWDEGGKEIKNYVVEKEAQFKGGADGWRKYLEKNLNATVAMDAGAPVGQYTVAVTFAVNKEGLVSNVRAISVPALCKPCGREAVAVISTGPAWVPAVQNNKPVIYQALQYITFVVDEVKGRKN